MSHAFCHQAAGQTPSFNYLPAQTSTPTNQAEVNDGNAVHNPGTPILARSDELAVRTRWLTRLQAQIGTRRINRWSNSRLPNQCR
jgi:hypothetical protein